MSKYKKRYAVVDNYHEGTFPVIAVCKTYEAAEEYIAGKIKHDRAVGNCYDYDIAGFEIEDKAAEGDPA